MSDVADATNVFQVFGDASTSDATAARASADQHYNDARIENGGDFLFSVAGIIDDPFVSITA